MTLRCLVARAVYRLLPLLQWDDGVYLFFVRTTITVLLKASEISKISKRHLSVNYTYHLVQFLVDPLNVACNDESCGVINISFKIVSSGISDLKRLLQATFQRSGSGIETWVLPEVTFIFRESGVQIIFDAPQQIRWDAESNSESCVYLLYYDLLFIIYYYFRCFAQLTTTFVSKKTWNKLNILRIKMQYNKSPCKYTLICMIYCVQISGNDWK